ncbi:hypothetical protein, partial [Rhizobium sp. SEMIA 4085]|uniref:hypothetical protein n=1 Tax=Rhizobium sp. SEMIA 4085 TaxID=2137761 RepID=UPI001AEEF734
MENCQSPDLRSGIDRQAIGVEGRKGMAFGYHHRPEIQMLTGNHRKPNAEGDCGIFREWGACWIRSL